jgi:ABC-type transport system involved in cytochrome c biogenesis permease subunit
MSTNSLSNLFVYFGIFLAAFNLVLFSIALTQNKMKSKISNVALSLTWLTGLFLVTALLLRGIAAQRAPWGNMYEFALASAVAIIFTFLVISIKKDIAWLGIFVIVPVILLLGLAVIVLYTESGPLVPALKSTWLLIHVTSAIISYGAFTINFALSLFIF